MEDKEYDVIVIGAGPAGCRAASLLAEKGKRTALVDRMSPGGSCLRSGCIPTKKLSLAAAHLREGKEQVRQAVCPAEDDAKAGRGSIEEAGFCTETERRMQQKAWDCFRKETGQMTKEMAEGLRLVQMSRRVRLLEGQDVFPEKDPEGLRMTIGGESFFAKDIVLATGSAPVIPEAVLSASKKYPEIGFYTTDTLREMKELPDRLIVIGGGTAGCEIADAMSAFVPLVKLYEAGGEILLSWSREPRRAVRRILERHGVELHEDCGAEAVWMEKILSNNPSGMQKTAIVIAAGRKPVFSGEKALACGLGLTQEGYIEADSCGRTTNPRIYCVGDANGQQRTAYYGTWQAEKAAELILYNGAESDKYGQGRSVGDTDENSALDAELFEQWDSLCAPVCLHTDPTAACTGMTIEEIRAQGRIIRIGRAPIYASGAARIRGYADGSVTVWRDPKTDLLLGAYVIGPEAEELIQLLQTYILYKIPCSLICRQVFAHPSLSELVRMAVEDACGGSPDLPAKRRR